MNLRKLSASCIMYFMEEIKSSKKAIAARKRMKKIPKEVLRERMRNIAKIKANKMSDRARKRHAKMMGQASVVARRASKEQQGSIGS